MKRILYLLIIQVLIIGCSTESKFKVGNVTLDLEVINVSSGFCEVNFVTSKPAYYYLSLIHI